MLLCLHAATAQHSRNRLAPGWVAGTAAPGRTPPGACHGGPCGGMAHYPTAPGIVYEAVFDVPKKPKKTDGICFYMCEPTLPTPSLTLPFLYHC